MTARHEENSGTEESGESMSSTMKDILVFICYRRSDGEWYANWINTLLNNHKVLDKHNSYRKIKTYFDLSAPGVADWKKYHFPSLQTADSFILINSPGSAKDLSRKGEPDWVYEEINWWVKNRSTAPIIITTTSDGGRWVPEPIAKKWPELNRLELSRSAIEDPQNLQDGEYDSRFLHRLRDTIKEDESATVFEQLERELKLNSKLRYASIALSATSVLAIGAASVSMYQSIRATQAEKEATANAIIAEENSVVAEQTSHILTSLFAAADPDGVFGINLTAGQLLETGTLVVDRSEYQPRIRSRLLRSMGTAYIGLGDADRALGLLNKSLQSAGEGTRTEVEELQLSLAFGEAFLMYEDERFDEAEKPLARASKLASDIYQDVPHENVSAVKLAQAEYLSWKIPSDFVAASELYQQALSIDTALNLPLNIARDQHRLGINAINRRNFSEADRWFTAAISTLVDRNAPLLTAQILHERAAVYFERSELPKALTDYRTTLSIFVDIYGKEHQQVAEVGNSIGRVLIELGQHQEAIEHLTRAVNVQKSKTGITDTALVWSQHNLGLALMLAENHSAAEIEFLNVMEACKKHKNSNPPDSTKGKSICGKGELRIYAQSLTHLAEIYMVNSRLGEAKQLLAEARNLFSELSEDSGWRFGLWQSAVGELHTRLCQFDEAHAELSQALTAITGRWQIGNPFRSTIEKRISSLNDAESSMDSC